MHIFLKLFFGLSVLFSSHLAFADISFLVQDQQGNALPDAVIEVTSESVQPAAVNELGIIDQIDKAFVPELVIVQQGQLVDFPNSDNIRHHVYWFSKAKTFELKLYADRPEQPVLFDHHGVVVPGCNIHDSMVGYLYVAADKRVSKTDNNGIARLAASSENTQISVLHAYNDTGPEHRGIYIL